MKQKNSMKREHSKPVCYAERENVRTKCKLCILLLIATGLAACSNDDEVAPVQERPITVTVSEKPFTTPTSNAAAVRSTRAAITTTESFSVFTIDYVYGSTPSKGFRTATKTAGTWTVDGPWPNPEKEVNWYAHSDGEFPRKDYEGIPYISFTVDENAAQQKDLLVATLAKSYSECGGHLNFTFDHACTALRFYIKKATNMDDYMLTVTDVKICNIVSQGEYYFATATWNLDSTRSQYTLYSGSGLELDSTNYTALGQTDAPYLFLIPQSLTAWDATTSIASVTAQSYLRIACTISKNGSNVFNDTAYIPFAATLAKGTQYDVKINIGKNSLYNSSGNKIITK
ncbi:MAG: fimbrillin family protein [Prevotella sp.]|nr:fimbrillin family protein [Prevotella sp.]